MYKKYYGADVQEQVIRLWSFSMYLCAKRLVPFVRNNINYFTQKLGYSEQLKAKPPLRTSTDRRGYNQKQVLDPIFPVPAIPYHIKAAHSTA